jgi:hypothetical protein
VIIRRRSEDARGRLQPAASSSKINFFVSCNNLNPAANSTTAFPRQTTNGMHRVSALTFHSPLCQKRTLLDNNWMSAKCQKRTYAPQQIAAIRLRRRHGSRRSLVVSWVQINPME